MDEPRDALLSARVRRVVPCPAAGMAAGPEHSEEEGRASIAKRAKGNPFRGGTIPAHEAGVLAEPQPPERGKRPVKATALVLPCRIRCRQDPVLALGDECPLAQLTKCPGSSWMFCRGKVSGYRRRM